MIERLAISWGGASLSVIATLAWLSAFVVSCPRVSVKSETKAGVEVCAAIPSLGPILVAIEVDDKESPKMILSHAGCQVCGCFCPPSLPFSNHAGAECLPPLLSTPACVRYVVEKARAPFAES